MAKYSYTGEDKRLKYLFDNLNENVKEYEYRSNFPATGEVDTIYIADDENTTYRWDGSNYVKIGVIYVLPVATSQALGGIKVGYTQNNKNYPVQLDGQKAFVNVPWVNTTYTFENGANGGFTVSDGTNTNTYLENVPNVTTDNQTPTVEEASTRTNLASGDTLKTIVGKIKKFFSDLKAVAFSGSYNDLIDTPTIPTVGDGELTIQLNDATVGNFTANQSGNETINLLPTELRNMFNPAGGSTDNRPASANITPDRNACVREFLATSTMVTGKPTKFDGSNADGNILHFSWDSNTRYATQLCVAHNGKGDLLTRYQSGAGQDDWTDWVQYVNFDNARFCMRTANNIQPADDTTTAWKALLQNTHAGLCYFMTYYDTANIFTNQPSTYGILETFLHNSLIYQRWKPLTTGNVRYRAGNNTGWNNSASDSGAFTLIATTAVATTSANGLMTAADKTKLDDLPTSGSVIPVSKGGTGRNTLNAYRLYRGNGTSAISPANLYQYADIVTCEQADSFTAGWRRFIKLAVSGYGSALLCFRGGWSKSAPYVGVVLLTIRNNLAKLRIIDGFSATNQVHSKLRAVNDSANNYFIELYREADSKNNTYQYCDILTLSGTWSKSEDSTTPPINNNATGANDYEISLRQEQFIPFESGTGYIGTSDKTWKEGNINDILALTLNGVTIGNDPKFTDTTYSVASASANGLMSSSDKIKLDNIVGGFWESLNTGGTIPSGGITLPSSYKELKIVFIVAPTGEDYEVRSETIITFNLIDRTGYTNKKIYVPLNSTSNEAAYAIFSVDKTKLENAYYSTGSGQSYTVNVYYR